MSNGMDIKEEYREIFLQESEDQLREWEEGLLELEKDPDNRELIDQIFRAIHTLKGSAGFVGFDRLQKVTHDLENGLQEVRDGVKKLNKKYIDILFEGLDICQKLIKAFSDGGTPDVDIDGFLKRLDLDDGKEGSNIEAESKQGKISEEKEQGGSKAEEAGVEGAGKIWELKIKVEAQKREAYLRTILLQSRLDEVGKILSINPTVDELLQLGDDFRFTVVLQSEKGEEDIKKAANIDLVNILEINERKSSADAKVEEVVAKADSEAVIKKEEKAVEEKHDKQKKAAETDKKPKDRAVKHHHEEVVRVPVGKLDVMLNLVGELVVQNSGFISIAGKLKEEYGRTSFIIDLEEKIDNLAKIAHDLQDAVMKVRMLPVGSVFSRFYRVVRDLAKVRNKDIELDVYGEDTEIDKKIIDRLSEPLVHLIRNAVDHGIESVEERKKSGKRIPAHIKLGAYQEGDHICIEVSDDGRGMNRDKILDKAIKKGVITEAEAKGLSNEEIFSLVFYPGFSTADKVTDISGRGVGLDVVKSTIEEMGGEVRIRSIQGYGTTIILTLPLTMAIISAILVEVSKALFAVPISSIKEIIKINMEDFRTIRETKVIRLRDEIVPVVHLSEVLMMAGNGNGYINKEGKDVPIIIVNYENAKVGIGVDELIGSEEIVIKSLSKHHEEIEGLAGASILGDGRIALVLDVQSLVRNYGKETGEEGYGIVKDYTDYSEESTAEYQEKHVTEKVEEGKNLEIESVFDVFDEEDKSEEHLKDKAQEPQEDREQGKIEIAKDGTEGEMETAPKSGEEGKGDERANTQMELLKLDAKRKEIIEELNINGAVNASVSLTQLMGRDVRVNFPTVEIVNIGEVANELGGEELPVMGIYVGISGEIVGGILMVISMENTFQFSDMLLRREAGTTAEIGEDEMSALGEMGNILAAAFVNSLADLTKLSAVTDVPEISMDMCQSVIDTILIRFNQPGDKILLTKAEISFSDDEYAMCHLILFLERSSIYKITGDKKNNSKFIEQTM